MVFGWISGLKITVNSFSVRLRSLWRFVEIHFLAALDSFEELRLAWNTVETRPRNAFLYNKPRPWRSTQFSTLPPPPSPPHSHGGMSVLYLLKRGVFVFFLILVKSGKLLYLCDSAATAPLPITVLPWWTRIPFNFLCFKGTVSWDRFQNFWQKFTKLGRTKGRGGFLNILEAPMILKRKKYIYCG